MRSSSSSPKAVSALESLTRAAGAIRDQRTGVPAHYGSPGAELGVCSRAIGISDRSDLEKLEIGPADDQQIKLVVGSELDEGACLMATGGRLCARSGDRLVVLADQGLGPSTALRESLDCAVLDRSSEWAVIGLSGAVIDRLLSRLDRVAEFSLPGSFSRVLIADTPCELARPSNGVALFIVGVDRAQDVWRALQAVGTPLGLNYVGSQAFRLFALRERSAAERAVSPYF
jgi:hypothetical protein